MGPRLAGIVGIALLVVACGEEAVVEVPPAPTVIPLLESSPPPPLPGTLRIASIFPTLGRYAISGEESHRGVRIAEEEILAAGPIHGREVAVTYYRTGSEPIDVEAAAKQAADAGVLAIVGCNASELSKAIREVAQTRGIPMISNVSTVSDLTWDPERGLEYEYVFRVCHSDAMMARMLARFASEDLGADRVAILYDDSRSYSKSLAQGFTENFSGGEPGGEVRSFYYGAYETDFRAQLRAVATFDPTVLFIPVSFIDASLIAVQAAQIGLGATLLGSDSWSNQLLFDRGGPAGPCYHGDHWFVEGPFRDAYVSRYGAPPNGARAALAHDALGVLTEAFRILGPLTDGEIDPARGRLPRTRARLRNQIERVRYEGVAGTIVFDRHGDPPQKGVIVEIDGGMRTLVKRFDG